LARNSLNEGDALIDGVLHLGDRGRRRIFDDEVKAVVYVRFSASGVLPAAESGDE
jgi:hypothetical protein